MQAMFRNIRSDDLMYPRDEEPESEFLHAYRLFHVSFRNKLVLIFWKHDVQKYCPERGRRANARFADGGIVFARQNFALGEESNR